MATWYRYEMVKSPVKSMSLIDRNVVIVAKDAKPTSVAAASAIYGRTGSIRRMVWEFIVRCEMNGATDFEIQRTLNLLGDTERPTRQTLEKDGLIMDTGTTRKNAKGHDCIVYRVCDEELVLL